MSCTSFETAPTKSASRSSVGELLTCPDVPTAVGDCVSLQSREKGFVPLTQLSSSTTTKPPRPSGIIPPPNPERPRMSSMSLRSPVHLMLARWSKKRADSHKAQVPGRKSVASREVASRGSQVSRKQVASQSQASLEVALATCLSLPCDGFSCD